MPIIRVLVFSSGIMEQGKQFDDAFIRSRLFREHETVLFNLPPGSRAVNGMDIQKKLGDHNFPESFKVDRVHSLTCFRHCSECTTLKLE
jgi:hypothetical protein